MTKQKTTLTKEGYEQLKVELKERVEERRPELKKLHEEAVNAGDLRENDGLDIVKEEHGTNERRIGEITAILENAEIIDGDDCTDQVQIGSTVKLLADEKELEYQIVSNTEANPLENKISDNSPIGQALMGLKVGSKATVKLPMGDVEYEVKEIC